MKTMLYSSHLRPFIHGVMADSTAGPTVDEVFSLTFEMTAEIMFTWLDN